ncbi:hypothetical protein BBJ28_00000243 [Nothophytophthora sp. Chile5]|nr:hypothetical protein BBJ28_00000243 [Nothophytophthora sp. Chile5]
MSSEVEGDSSADFAASASGSASRSVSSQYDDDSFAAYSDSFESDSGSDDEDTSSNIPILACPSVAAELGPWRSGDRVQVFWQEENEWFDGAIREVTIGRNEARYHVHYDDGEDAWEVRERRAHWRGPSVADSSHELSILQEQANLRAFPTAMGVNAYDQLQLLLPLSGSSAAAMVGRTALVYWPDAAEWYRGIVAASQATPPMLYIEYDDGDSRWEQVRNESECLPFHPAVLIELISVNIRLQEHGCRHILLSRAVTTSTAASLPPTPSQSLILPPAPTPPPPLERVLHAHPYQCALSDHFQPIRVTRPYRCTLKTHIGSVVTAQRPYTERKYIHDVQTALEASLQPSSSTLLPGKTDSITQTTLPLSLPEA